MSQALHIFRKDARGLRIELAVVAALNVAFVWAHIKAAAPGIEELSHPSVLAYLTSFLLAMGWWFLIARAIHEEALPGDRQFWVTRPYEWKQLLAAKLLFVLAFVNAPLLVAQIVILAAAGYASPGGLPKLLWMQFTVTLIVLMPAFAMGAVTRSFARLVLFAIGLLVSVYFLLSGYSVFVGHTYGIAFVGIGSGGWLTNAIVAITMFAGAVLTVVWQYRRRARAARLTGAATLILIVALYLFLPWTPGYTSNGWIFRQPEARNVSVTVGQPIMPIQPPELPHEVVAIDVPFEFTNVPPGETAKAESIIETFEDPSGLRSSPGWMSAPAQQTGLRRFWLDRSFYDRVAGKPIAFRATLYITLQRPAKWPLPDGRVTALPGGWRCTVATSGQTHTIFCVAPFHDPWDTIDFHPPDKDGHNGSEELVARSFSPWPASFAFSPVFTDNSRCEGDCAIRFRQEEPLAWFRRDVKVTIQLPPAPRVTP